MYVISVMSWAIRQLNSGHEATLIPIKKQNLTQGVRKKSIIVHAMLHKDILTRGKALKSQNSIEKWLRKGFVKGAQGIASAAARI